MMNSHLSRKSYRLCISWYSATTLMDEDEVIEIHRMSRAFEPLMKRSGAGFVNQLTFSDEGAAIEIVCDDVEYLFKTIAPVMGCFAIATEGFPGGSEPSAYYSATLANGEPVEEIKVDLGEYFPNNCESDEL